MKKIISLILTLIMVSSLCLPAAVFTSAAEDKNLLRLVVPENWEMKEGDSRTVEAVFSSEITNRVLTWSSDSPDVACVDQWGRVTALKKRYCRNQRRNV